MKTYKNTTPIPPCIESPDRVETRLGTLNFFDGFPDDADGSVDVYFGPQAPTGKENNWVQTIPGKGWNVIFRLYGPFDAWFDKTWRLGEIELMA
jgi:hypothetical protein